MRAAPARPDAGKTENNGEMGRERRVISDQSSAPLGQAQRGREGVHSLSYFEPVFGG